MTFRVIITPCAAVLEVVSGVYFLLAVLATLWEARADSAFG